MTIEPTNVSPGSPEAEEELKQFMFAQKCLEASVRSSGISGTPVQQNLTGAVVFPIEAGNTEFFAPNE